MKAVFDDIRASDDLKNDTKAYVEKYRRQPRQIYRMVAAAACALLLLVGGWLYITPTAHISIDTDPSLVLEINRFDRVLSAGSTSDQADAIWGELNLVNLNYTAAMEQIFSSSAFADLMDDGEIITVSVIAPEGEQSSRLLAEAQTCIADNKEAECYYADPETAAQARTYGLPYSKYRALQELQALDPDITADDVRNLSMRQIRDWIDALTQPATEPATPDTPAEPSGETTTPVHQGQGHGSNNGNNSGNGNGNGIGNGNGHGKNG